MREISGSATRSNFRARRISSSRGTASLTDISFTAPKLGTLSANKLTGLPDALSTDPLRVVMPTQPAELLSASSVEPLLPVHGEAPPPPPPQQQAPPHAIQPPAAGRSASPLSPLPPPPTPRKPLVALPIVEWEATFRLMAYRRVQRELQGTYRKERQWVTLVWVLMFLGLEWGLATVTLTQGRFNLQINLSVKLLISLLGPLVIVLLLYCVVRVPAVSGVSVFRWCLLWIALGSIATLVVSGGSHELLVGFDEGGKLGVIAALTGGACLLTILLWCHYAKLYPLSLLTGSGCLVSLRWYFRVRPLPDRPGFFEYAIPPPFPLSLLPCCRAEHSFGYRGELDGRGRPHGLGTWFDDAPHGECLQGVWAHGVPIGPFRSAEYHSDYRVANVRLGFCTNRKEPTIGERYWRPMFNEGGLRWGVGALEQSVAGAWFKNLPKASVVAGPEEGRDARWCLEQLISLRPETELTKELVVSILADGARPEP